MANVVLFAAILLVATAGTHADKKKTVVPHRPGGPPRWVGIFCTATAHFDMGGVRGTIQFYQPEPNRPVEIHVQLTGLDQFSDRYPWRVYMYPVRFGLLRGFPCSEEEVGDRYDPTGVGNPPDYDEACANDTDSCQVGDLSGKLGTLTDQDWQSFTDSRLSLFGPQSIVGRSIVIERQGPPATRWVCANIEYNGVQLQTTRFPFSDGPLQGDVIFRRVKGRDDVKILVDLYRIDNGSADSRNHNWNLRTGTPGENGDCNAVGHVYGANTWHDEHDAFARCSPEFQRECQIGNLTAKCGPLQVRMGRIRACCTDEQLGTIPFNKLRELSLAIQGANGAPNIMACASAQPIYPECALVTFMSSRRMGLFGNLLFYQSDPNDRTFVRTYVTGLRQQNASFVIRENPVPDPRPDPARPGYIIQSDCSNTTLGSIIMRPGAPIIGVPPGDQTGDTVILGNLGPKLTIPPGSQSYRVTASSSYLPLFGPYNITGHSLVLVRDDTGEPWACGTINRWHPFPERLVASITGYQESTKK